MKLFNTLGRQIQEFKPQKPDAVSLYTCGPTVYDYAHIGNLRSFVFDDTLRRSLEVNGYNVRHVMNITDVGHLASDADTGEDKLEKGAQRENKSVWEVAEQYIKAFKHDMKQLNILPPNAYHKGDDNYARATDFIPQQIEIVKLLLNKDRAYITDQAIYFDITKLSDYGKLSGQKLADKEVGARQEVVVDKHKHHPQDFAVWFFTVGRFANHSMAWDSPWGKGFPGWHLECSAIIHATLHEPIDIHTGGVDHIGTHHTNEMAQTEAAFGVELAKYWIHNEHLLVDGQKMAKSAGNFYTLKDITDKGYDPLALRLLFLQAHYRSQMNFTWEALDGASQFLNRLGAWADTSKQLAFPVLDRATESHLKNEITAALSNDLNTARALVQINEFIDKSAPTPEILKFIDQALGLELSSRSDISTQQKELIEQRQKARNSRDWPLADQLRKQLSEQGIEINDTERGPVWYRNN